MAKISEKNRIAHYVLKEIFDENPEIFRDNNSLRGYIADFFRGEPRMKRILRQAISENVAVKIWELNDLDYADRQMRIDSMKLAFREEHFFKADISNYIIDCFVYSMGWIDALEEFSEEPEEQAIQFKGLTAREYPGGTYLGELNEEEEHNGFGIFDREDGVLYAGEWKVNLRNGCGIVLDPNNKEKYAGEWRMNKPAGLGVKIFNDGTKCAGEWKNGKLKGIAMEYSPNGNYRIGRMEEGVITGHGILALPSGEYVIGEFRNGKLNGKCTRVYQNGQTQEENWKDGVKL